MSWIYNWIIILSLLKPIIAQINLTDNHGKNHNNHRNHQRSTVEYSNIKQHGQLESQMDKSLSESQQHKFEKTNVFEIGQVPYTGINGENSDRKNPSSMEHEMENVNFHIRRGPEGALHVANFSTRKPISTRSSSDDSNGTLMKKNNSKDIVFPDDMHSPRCKESGKTFCTEVQNYPSAIIENALKMANAKFDTFFGDDALYTPESFNISQRIDPGEETLCESIERIIYPRSGETKEKYNLFIIQSENRTQGIRVEECTKIGQKCNMSESFPNCYVTECKQKYIYRQLAAINEGKIVAEPFRVPSCCQCVVKYNC